VSRSICERIVDVAGAERIYRDKEDVRSMYHPLIST
jgi:hypothetical protein